MKEELEDDFEDIVIDLFYHPIDFDCYELRRAVQELGTLEDILIEILSMRSNNEIYNIKKRYGEIFPGRDLHDDIENDVSGYFKTLLLALLEANRPDTVNYDEIKESVLSLYEQSQKWFPDEEVFIKVFTKQSKAAFIIINELYNNIDSKGLLETVKDSFSGDFEDGLVGIYYSIIAPSEYYATKIHNSIKEMGTNELTLNRIIVTRAEKDIEEISKNYSKLFDSDMIKDIIDDTDGYYKTMLISLIKGEYAISSHISYNCSILILIIYFMIF